MIAEAGLSALWLAAGLAAYQFLLMVLALRVRGAPENYAPALRSKLHALTGDSHVAGPAGPDQPTPGWWDALVGPGRPLDPA